MNDLMALPSYADSLFRSSRTVSKATIYNFCCSIVRMELENNDPSRVFRTIQSKSCFRLPPCRLIQGAPQNSIIGIICDLIFYVEKLLSSTLTVSRSSRITIAITFQLTGNIIRFNERRRSKTMRS